MRARPLRCRRMRVVMMMCCRRHRCRWRCRKWRCSSCWSWWKGCEGVTILQTTDQSSKLFCYPNIFIFFFFLLGGIMTYLTPTQIFTTGLSKIVCSGVAVTAKKDCSLKWQRLTPSRTVCCRLGLPLSKLL